MKFLKVLITIASAIFFVSSPTFSQEFKTNMYLSESTAKMLPPGFSQKSYGNFLSQGISEIIRTSKSVIMDSAAFKYLDSKGISIARELLIGEANLPIFLTGYELRSNSLQELLGLETKANIKLDRESNGKIFATGLYKRGINRGSFLHIDLISDKRPPEEEILSEIKAEVEKIKKIGKAKKPKKPEQPYWVDMAVHRPKIIKKPFGKYNQSVIIRKKINDNSTEHDFWTVLLVNESVSGIIAYKSEHVNKENDTKLDANHDEQEIIDYQPGGDVSEGTNISFTLGIPPSVSASWNTGKTKLRNMSDTDRDFCRWVVKYNTTGDEANNTYKWKPGTEKRIRQAAPLKIKIENNVKWHYVGRPKSFYEKFEYTIEP